MAKWPTWPAPGAARAAAGRSRKLHVWFDSEASSHASPAGAAGHALTGSSAHINHYNLYPRALRGTDSSCAFAGPRLNCFFAGSLPALARISGAVRLGFI